MRYREINDVIGGEKRRPAAVDLEVNPAIFVAVGIVVGKGDAAGRLVAGEEAHLNKDLKAVADADYETVCFDEGGDGISEAVFEFAGEDPACGDVVAIGESAGDGESLEVVKGDGTVHKAVYMRKGSLCARLFECVCRFDVTVGACGAKDEDIHLGQLDSPAIRGPVRTHGDLDDTKKILILAFPAMAVNNFGDFLESQDGLPCGLEFENICINDLLVFVVECQAVSGGDGAYKGKRHASKGGLEIFCFG